MATLQPGNGADGYDYTFRYAFFAAMEGRYCINIRNLAKNEIKTRFFVE